MSFEHGELDLDEQLRSFANTLELDTGELIRPTRQQPTTAADVDGSVDVGPLATVALVPSRREQRRLLLPVAAAAAAVVVVVGGLVVLGNDATPSDTPGPAQSVDPVPASTAAPARTTESSGTAAPTTVPDRASIWRGGLLADLELEALLPLASVSNGDFVVPTAPVDWRILSGGFGINEAGLSNSSVTIIEGRPDGTTGPWIELSVSWVGLCVERPDLNCATSDDSVEINGVVWQPFTEINGARAIIGDRIIDVQVDDPELQGSVLDQPLIVKYLESLRVGTGDDYWETIRTEIGQACWTCSDAENVDEPTQVSVDEIDSEAI